MLAAFDPFNSSPIDAMGEYAGQNPPMPPAAHQHLAGAVVRSHRRRGLLRSAMKLWAIEFAIQQGAMAIRTTTRRIT